jgi:hypothetical protein
MPYPVVSRGKPVRIYNSPVQRLTGPAAILAACDHHPFARFGAGAVADPIGVTDSSGTLFVGGAGDDRTTGYLLGRPDTDLIGYARDAGILDTLGWLNLARPTPFSAI